MKHGTVVGEQAQSVEQPVQHAGPGECETQRKKHSIGLSAPNGGCGWCIVRRHDACHSATRVGYCARLAVRGPSRTATTGTGSCPVPDLSQIPFLELVVVWCIIFASRGHANRLDIAKETNLC